MIWFHVGNYKVIDMATCEHALQICKPLLSCSRVHGIHDCYLLVQNHIRIVGNAIRNRILALEQVNRLIICANIYN